MKNTDLQQYNPHRPSEHGATNKNTSHDLANLINVAMVSLEVGLEDIQTYNRVSQKSVERFHRALTALNQSAELIQLLRPKKDDF
jgi:hypothetical protein